METSQEIIDPSQVGAIQVEGANPQLDAKANREQEYRDKLFNYPDAIIRLKQLQQKWDGEIQETNKRRLVRNIDISPKALRDQGKLRPDETIIPIRLIDMNIRREQPSYINYLKGSNRLSIFQCVDNPQLDCQQIESDFTNGNQYIGWETPHFKVLDGSQAHGWDAVEVIYDATKPLHVAIEHIGHENLFFGIESIELQACEVIIRKYSFSQLQLKLSIDDYGFSEAQVNLLLEKLQAGNSQAQDGNINVYKKLFKYNKCVYVAWYSDKEGCTDWLKAPSKLFVGRAKQVQVMVDVPQQIMGVEPHPVTGQPLSIMQTKMVPTPQLQWQDVDEPEFPIFLLPYSETEQQMIIAHKGRVFFDQHKQEGMTAIASGFVNALNRSANVYGSVKGLDVGSTAAPKQLDTELTHGKIYDKEINFWGHQAPDPTTLNALQYLDAQNASETGQTAFAVNNRKDSRKTAKEIGVAENQAALLSGVQVSLYSTFLRSVYSYIWLIVQSQALQDKIKFLLIEKQEPDMATGQMTKTFVNDKARIGLVYNIKAAGDVDVIQRQELRSKMQQDWPVFQQTPIANSFLKEYIRLSYPAMSEKWVAEFERADMIKQVVAKLADLVMTMTSPQDLLALPPEAKNEIALTLQAAQQIVAPEVAQQEQQTQE